MNKNQAVSLLKKHIDIIQAYINGKPIQSKYCREGEC